MTNVRKEQLKTCITMDGWEFQELIQTLFKKENDTLYVELTMDGIEIYYENEELPTEDILQGLAEYFEVNEVTSYHIDNYDYPLIWIVYKD